MSPQWFQRQRDGIRARLRQLLDTKIPFDHWRVGQLLDCAWQLGQQGDADWEELWTEILVAYGER